MTKQAILFDCDGTLVDSEYVCAQSDISILAEFGIHYASVHEFLDEFMGVANGKIVRILNERHGKDIPVEWFVEEYERRALPLIPEGLGYFKESVAYVKTLAERGIPVAVISNGKKKVVELELKVAGYDMFGDNIFTVEDSPNPKPAPDLYLLAAKTMGVDPVDCIVVEDSSTGASAGLAAGMRVMGYHGYSRTPEKARAALEQAGCHRIINSLSDLDAELRG